MKSYVMDGNDIVTERHILDALSFNGDGGIAGSTAILFDDNALEGPVLKNNKEFKASKTGVRETHEVFWNIEQTPHVFTISDITLPEVVTQRKIDNYESNSLSTNIIK